MESSETEPSSLMSFYTILFVALAAICAVIKSTQGKSQQTLRDNQFKNFQNNFLLVYLLAMGSDWLQGPYIYILYSSYKFSKADISLLFIAGFLSGAVFGTVVGTLADKYGRKRMTILFGVCYSISCVTKYFNNFSVLLLGRILGGISTSLLFSVIEAWMVAEHNTRDFSAALLTNTFSVSSFYNAIVAIAAGLTASTLAGYFGYVAPFGFSIVLLLIMTYIVMSTWTENYGNSQVKFLDTFDETWAALRRDLRIPLLCLIQSFFEAAMYTFVFMWSPTLTQDPTVGIPFGLVFACFMVAVMIGSTIFTVATEKYNVRPEEIAVYMLASAAASLSVPILTEDVYINSFAFMVFEVCCGVYWPCLGTMRSKIIPERCRSGVMNLARLPLNLFVVIVLSSVGNRSNSTSYIICTICLLLALFLQRRLITLPAPTTDELPQQDTKERYTH